VDTRKVKGVHHYIFEDEGEFRLHFERNGLPVPPLKKEWRDGHEGDWVVADDGGVVQILKRGGKKITYIRTAVGTFFNKKHDSMDTDVSKHQCRYTVSGKFPKPGRPGAKNLTQRERIWVALLRSGMDPYSAYEQAFRTKSPRTIHSQVDRLFAQERIVNELKKEVKEALEKSGVTPNWVIETAKAIVEEGDNKSKVALLREFMKLLDMYPDDSKLDPSKLIPAGSGIPLGEYDNITKELDSGTLPVEPSNNGDDD